MAARGAGLGGRRRRRLYLALACIVFFGCQALALLAINIGWVSREAFMLTYEDFGGAGLASRAATGEPAAAGTGVVAASWAARSRPPPPEAPIAVVVMACKRPDYLTRTMDSVLKHVPRGAESRFPIFISQDGDDGGVRAAAAGYRDRGVTYLNHIEAAPPEMEKPTDMVVYYRIAAHYKFALGELFGARGFGHVIILEDDMELSPDFYSYFAAAAKLIDADESLMCASSWNDNGQAKFVADATAVLRSDFFPGLGWMLPARLWRELGPIWPAGFWDDWMRLQKVRRGRQCLRPEVCRTYNFGEQGASLGQFYAEHLRDIKLNAESIDFSSLDLSYLLPGNYDRHLSAAIAAAAPAATVAESAALAAAGLESVITYADESQFRSLAEAVGVFEEWKDGIPRASYRGVVTFRLTGTRVFLLPLHATSLRAQGVVPLTRADLPVPPARPGDARVAEAGVRLSGVEARLRGAGGRGGRARARLRD